MSTSLPLSEHDVWSQKLADVLRSMPAELREPTALRSVLVDAMKNLAASPVVAAPATAATADVAPAVTATPSVGMLRPEAPAAQPEPAQTAEPETPPVSRTLSWAEEARLNAPKLPSLKKVGSTLNLPLRMAQELIANGTFNPTEFRLAYGNGWNQSNREFGRQFADELARCTERQIAEGSPWTRSTHHALVGLTALTSTVMTTGINTLMDRLTFNTPLKTPIYQSIAATLQDVLVKLPAGHPASDPEVGMVVRAQFLETLVKRQTMEMAPKNPMRHLRRSMA